MNSEWASVKPRGANSPPLWHLCGHTWFHINSSAPFMDVSFALGQSIDGVMGYLVNQVFWGVYTCYLVIFYTDCHYSLNENGTKPTYH